MINVNFVGRLGADAEVLTSKNGNEFLSMRVATDDYSNGERGTQWLRVRYSNPVVAKVKGYMTKGKMVHVFGTLSASTYVNKNGETVISFDVMADRVSFVSVGSGGEQKPEVETVDASKFSTDDAPVQKEAEKQKAKAKEVVGSVATKVSTASDDDDDLPF